MSKLRIFISSPGDVFEERAIAERVIQRLQSEYVGRVVLEPVLWEHEPLVATAHFQEQLVRPSECDVVVSILWSRLGTRLPAGFSRADGSRYDSGTEYEFEDALEGYRANGKPDLLVYRKTAPPSVRLDDENALLERLQQKKKLDDFVSRWFHDKGEGTLTAAFHQFESPSDFEIALEGHLHKLIERKLPEALARGGEVAAVWKKGSPFRGLHAFEFEHAPVFFGRTKAVSDILHALRQQSAQGRAFVLVLGMSGGGKSSVVRAGVLPMLMQPGVIEGVALWRRAVFRPSDTPNDLFTSMATALLREHALPLLDSDGEGPAALARVLRESPHAAVQLIKSALDGEAAKLTAARPGNATKLRSRLALVVDQMEEMFTQDGVTAKERKAFANTLDALARSGRVWVIGTLRSDFYPRLVDLPMIGALKEGAGQYDLMPPVASEIGQMIRLPTRAAGLRFEEDPASSERLDDMLRDAAAERPELLPLLQFTLEELYQRRTPNGMLTLDAYRELGGVEGSLAKRAETVFREQSPEVQAALPRVLNALVSIEQDGHEAIGRKRAPWKDVSTDEGRALLETFVASRLFVTELADDGSAVVTVAHEALLWHWPAVQEWVAQNRDNLRIRGRVAGAAARWAAENRPSDLLLPRGKPLGEAETLLQQGIVLDDLETDFIRASVARAKRTQKLKSAIVATLAGMAIMAGSAAFWAQQQRNLAIEASRRAEIEAETARQTTDFMVGLFDVLDPGEARGNTVTAREIMDQGAQRIEQELAGQPATQATLMETMGTVYMSLGLYDQAASLLQSALDRRKALYGDRHLEVARSLQRLGEVLKLKAEYEPAGLMFRDALALRREMLGNEHVDTARSMYGLADLLGRMGEFSAAEPLFREALVLQRRLIGERSKETAQSLEGLALNLYDQGKYGDAVPLLRDAVAMQRELHDGPHPDLAQALNNLGFVISEVGEYEESEQLFREALAMKRVLYPGDAHPEIAMGLNNVAFVLHDQRKFIEAEVLYREAIDMQRKLLGDDHPDVAMALNNLAFLTYEKGDRDSAITMSRETLDMFRRTVGDEHPSVARSMNNLAMWLMEANDYASAEPLLRESLELRRKLLGAEHADVAASMTLLAALLIDSERYEEALSLAAGAKAICIEAFSPDHWRTATAANAEGAALAGLQRYDEAEKLLLDSFNVLRKDPGALPFYTSNANRWLAKFYNARGRPGEAAKYLAMRAEGEHRED
ncbi:MAG TPA: tetratricopeptide repeat protein [Woeseiaceae bacterium]|nr:tetratricopeptide repeat protein [Woeseiaceae bacterium]